MNFIDELTLGFKANANAENAKYMQDYMRGLFTFYGLKTNDRRAIFKEACLNHKQEIKTSCRDIALKLYETEKREYHYCAIELLIKELKKKFVKDDIILIEHLIVTHSWWDSVDTISKYLLGVYLQQFPEETENVINRFSDSDNMWLNRSAIIFQLGYKKDTIEDILFTQSLKHKHSNEFFIQKAIGRALREYGKTNPQAVRDFVTKAGLKPLSAREALKNL
ncbi:DNA alkylation repair protein [Flavobacterium alkalisoli]|uniref:DNA alkylation repair protein n=1 Tax=Flavobacterium alkalisoli TaxID=2602769 RepID=A0A5B9FRQ8_9FLAO|nr:DNA alkylation repair protein [Flavobacterium alkalisoli]QEE50053.1 DNA alkylation repair protein [Flavobacterium alkalisoli]